MLSTGYYSNARFLLLPLRKLMDIDPTKTVTFYGDRTLTLQEIEQNLVDSMDIVFDVLTGSSKEEDVEDDESYQNGKALFVNEDGLPDGSAVYGILLNSHSVAVGGFGASVNTDDDHGSVVLINDVHVHDLRLSVNEIPALYFDKWTDPNATTNTIQKGPFGDVFDLRKVMDAGVELVEAHEDDPTNLRYIKYIGNPLADAQIALAIHGDSGTLFGSSLSSELLSWAQGLSTFPSSCSDFVCNGDVMFHSNKGVVGLRMDGIEDAIIVDLSVSNLTNESPLVCAACGSYEGPHDGGLGVIDTEGTMGTDMRGISVTGGDVHFLGKNLIESLNSFYGDTVGLDLIEDAVLEFDTGSDVIINDIVSGSMLTREQFDELQANDETPYPNNFDLCTVKYDDWAEVTGDVPEDKVVTDCVYNGEFGSSSNCKHPDRVYDVILMASMDGTYPGTVMTHQSRPMPSDRDTLELRTAAYDFFRTHYGFDFDPDIEGFQSLFDSNGSLLVSVNPSQVAIPLSACSLTLLVQLANVSEQPCTSQKVPNLGIGRSNGIHEIFQSIPDHEC